MEEVSIFHRYLCWSMADLGVGFPGGSGICLQCRGPRFNLWVGKIPWRREWLPTQVFLPGEFHGQRSVAGYSPWGCKELRTAEWLTLSVFFFFFPRASGLGVASGEAERVEHGGQVFDLINCRVGGGAFPWVTGCQDWGRIIFLTPQIQHLLHAVHGSKQVFYVDYIVEFSPWL